jgi:hypothetical protein
LGRGIAFATDSGHRVQGGDERVDFLDHEGSMAVPALHEAKVDEQLHSVADGVP